MEWVVVAIVVIVAWRLLRGLRKSFQRMSQQRAEAFSNAVSSAVQAGVQSAISAAVADANAAATGGSVQLHIGDNLARFIADNYDGTYDDDDGSAYDDDRMDSLQQSSNRRGVGGLPNAARRGEPASGRAIRRRNNDRTNVRNLRKPPVSRGELEQ